MRLSPEQPWGRSTFVLISANRDGCVSECGPRPHRVALTYGHEDVTRSWPDPKRGEIDNNFSKENEDPAVALSRILGIPNGCVRAGLFLEGHLRTGEFGDGPRELE